MLPDPIDVGLQSIGKAIGARFEPLGLVEENEIEPPQRLGHGVIFHPPAHDWREAFIQRGGVCNFLQGHL